MKISNADIVMMCILGLFGFTGCGSLVEPSLDVIQAAAENAIDLLENGKGFDGYGIERSGINDNPQFNKYKEYIDIRISKNKSFYVIFIYRDDSSFAGPGYIVTRYYASFEPGWVQTKYPPSVSFFEKKYLRSKQGKLGGSEKTPGADGESGDVPRNASSTARPGAFA